MGINRRDFLRLTGTGVALGACAPLFRTPFMSAPLRAAMLGEGTGHNLLVIFLRGGADTANAVIPAGDPEYNDTNRPTLFISDDDSLDLGNSFARAHPSLARIVDDVPDVAWVHAVGYTPYFSRSHFTGQQYWENGMPGSLEERGWLNELVVQDESLDDLAFPAASISFNNQVLFRGERPLAHIPDLRTYRHFSVNLDAPTLQDDKFLGVAPDGDAGKGLLGVYGRKGVAGIDQMVRDQGLTLGSSLAIIAKEGVDPEAYSPSGDATYPQSNSDATGEDDVFFNDGAAFNFFRQLQHAVQLLKETECRIAGVQIGGWDTHSSQVNQLTRLLRIVAHGFRSVYRDTSGTGGLWDNLTVVVMSEFSRTSLENGSLGTDHGQAGLMIIGGGNVNAGVYNCDEDTWPGMLSDATGRYIGMAEDGGDFRDVIAELLTKSGGFGVSNAARDEIFPDYTFSSSDDLGIITDD